MFKKLDKDILRAIEWVAAEYKYILSLDNQLQAIENEKDLREKERSVRKAISILKYVNRAEFRAARFEDRTIKDLGLSRKSW